MSIEAPGSHSSEKLKSAAELAEERERTKVESAPVEDKETESEEVSESESLEDKKAELEKLKKRADQLEHERKDEVAWQEAVEKVHKLEDEIRNREIYQKLEDLKDKARQIEREDGSERRFKEVQEEIYRLERSLRGDNGGGEAIDDFHRRMVEGEPVKDFDSSRETERSETAPQFGEWAAQEAEQEELLKGKEVVGMERYDRATELADEWWEAASRNVETPDLAKTGFEKARERFTNMIKGAPEDIKGIPERIRKKREKLRQMISSAREDLKRKREWLTDEDIPASQKAVYGAVVTLVSSPFVILAGQEFLRTTSPMFRLALGGDSGDPGPQVEPGMMEATEVQLGDETNEPSATPSWHKEYESKGPTPEYAVHYTDNDFGTPSWEKEYPDDGVEREYAAKYTNEQQETPLWEREYPDDGTEQEYAAKHTQDQTETPSREQEDEPDGQAHKYAAESPSGETDTEATDKGAEQASGAANTSDDETLEAARRYMSGETPGESVETTNDDVKDVQDMFSARKQFHAENMDPNKDASLDFLKNMEPIESSRESYGSQVKTEHDAFEWLYATVHTDLDILDGGGIDFESPEAEKLLNHYHDNLVGSAPDAPEIDRRATELRTVQLLEESGHSVDDLYTTKGTTDNPQIERNFEVLELHNGVPARVQVLGDEAVINPDLYTAEEQAALNKPEEIRVESGGEHPKTAESSNADTAGETAKQANEEKPENADTRESAENPLTQEKLRDQAEEIINQSYRERVGGEQHEFEKTVEAGEQMKSLYGDDVENVAEASELMHSKQQALLSLTTGDINFDTPQTQNFLDAYQHYVQHGEQGGPHGWEEINAGQQLRAAQLLEQAGYAPEDMFRLVEDDGVIEVRPNFDYDVGYKGVPHNFTHNGQEIDINPGNLTQAERDSVGLGWWKPGDEY